MIGEFTFNQYNSKNAGINRGEWKRKLDFKLKISTQFKSLFLSIFNNKPQNSNYQTTLFYQKSSLTFIKFCATLFYLPTIQIENIFL